MKKYLGIVAAALLLAGCSGSAPASTPIVANPPAAASSTSASPSAAAVPTNARGHVLAKVGDTLTITSEGVETAKTDLRPLGTNGRSDHPRCHPTSALPRSRDRRDGGSVRSALPAIAGALRRSLLARTLPRVRSGGSRVHSPPPPPRSSTGRRVSVPAHDGYSSRSQPTSSVAGSLRGRSRNGQALRSGVCDPVCDPVSPTGPADAGCPGPSPRQECCV